MSTPLETLTNLLIGFKHHAREAYKYDLEVDTSEEQGDLVGFIHVPTVSEPIQVWFFTDGSYMVALPEAGETDELETESLGEIELALDLWLRGFSAARGHAS